MEIVLRGNTFAVLFNPVFRLSRNTPLIPVKSLQYLRLLQKSNTRRVAILLCNLESECRIVPGSCLTGNVMRRAHWALQMI